MYILQKNKNWSKNFENDTEPIWKRYGKEILTKLVGIALRSKSWQNYSNRDVAEQAELGSNGNRYPRLGKFKLAGRSVCPDPVALWKGLLDERLLAMVHELDQHAPEWDQLSEADIRGQYQD